MDDLEVEFDFEDNINAEDVGQPAEAPQSMPANARKNYRQVRSVRPAATLGVQMGASLDERSARPGPGSVGRASCPLRHGETLTSSSARPFPSRRRSAATGSAGCA